MALRAMQKHNEWEHSMLLIISEAPSSDIAGCFYFACGCCGVPLLPCGGTCVCPLWGRVRREAHDMSKDPIEYFYTSRAWRRARKGYIAEKGGLCERCLARGLIVPGEEVHHKVKLTLENLGDPTISLSWQNLELLCKDCHLQEHSSTRWRADELGHVTL